MRAAGLIVLLVLPVALQACPFTKTVTTYGDLEAKPSEVLSCFRREALASGSKNRLLDVADKLALFYAGTDVARSQVVPAADRVDLEDELRKIRAATHGNEWDLRSDVAKAFAKLRDMHTLYSMPKKFVARFYGLVDYGSRLDASSGKQVIFIRKLLPNRADSSFSSSLKVGDVVEKINDVDALEYLSNLAYRNNPVKTKGQALNIFLNTGDNLRSSSYGMISADSEVITVGGNKYTIPILSDPLAGSGGSSRAAQVLASEDLFANAKNKVTFPEGDPDPIISCGDIDGKKYLRISTFNLKHVEAANSVECEILRRSSKAVRAVGRCIKGAKEIVIDVRDNGGGHLIYMHAMLYTLFPGQFKLAGKTSNDAAEASKYGWWQISLGSMPQAYVDAYAAEVSTGVDVYTEEGAKTVEKVIGASTISERVVSGGNRQVTKRFSMLPTAKKYFDQLRCTYTYEAQDQPASELEKAVIISRGSCGSACSHFMEVLVEQNLAKVITLGGIKGEVMEASGFSNAPLARWSAFSKSMNKRLPSGTAPLPTLDVDQEGDFGFCQMSWYAGKDDQFSAEYNIQKHPGEHLDYWPPFDSKTELAIFQTASGTKPISGISSKKDNKKDSEEEDDDDTDRDWMILIIVLIFAIVAVILFVSAALYYCMKQREKAEAREVGEGLPAKASAYTANAAPHYRGEQQV